MKAPVSCMTALRQLVCLLALAATACTDGGVRRALRMAGDNRPELQRVLDRYGADPADSLKLCAARYLIRHMPYHVSLGGIYGRYCDAVDSILASGGAPDDLARRIGECSGRFRAGVTFDEDLKTVTADLLVRHIDTAFVRWQQGPWARHLDFDAFCEWLLPYKIVDRQPLGLWREELFPLFDGEAYVLEAASSDYRGNPRMAACAVNDALRAHNPQHLVHTPSGMPVMRVATLLDRPFGTCVDYSYAAALVMRSKGIPVSVDYTPQWPDRRMGHYWNTVLTLRGVKCEFNGFGKNPSEAHYPDAKFAKILRMTYRPDEELLARVRRGCRLPPSIANIFCRDVTDEYMATSDLRVDLFPDRLSRRDVYLAVFDNFEWVPVHWGEVRGNRARFRRMGRNVLYLPVCWDGERSVPAGEPFVVEPSGRVRTVGCDTLRRQALCVKRKFPLLRHVCSRRDVLRGGTIEASDDPAFADALVAARLPGWEVSAGSVDVSHIPPRRYWRFRSTDGRRCEMAELYFWREGCGERMRGRIHAGPGRHPGLDDFKWFDDDDPLTSLWAEGDDFWSGYDFGVPTRVDRISFIRRGDGNDILPGAEYELFCWCGRAWRSLGRQTARDVQLVWPDAPAEGLFYILCRSYGQDNRIFERLDGRIVWR